MRCPFLCVHSFKVDFCKFFFSVGAVNEFCCVDNNKYCNNGIWPSNHATAKNTPRKLTSEKRNTLINSLLWHSILVVFNFSWVCMQITRFSLRSTLWLCVILTNTYLVGRHCSYCNNSAIKIFDGVNALVRLQIFDINPAQKHSSAFCSTENLYAVGQFFAVSFFRFFAFYSFFAHMWTHANFVALICFLTLTLLHVWHLLVLWHSHRKQILCSKVNKTRRKKNPNKARPDKRSRFFKYFRILCMLEAVFFGYCFVVACPCHSSHFIVYRIGAVARLSRANKK